MIDTFDTLRPRLEDYLRRKGIDPRKRFRCLNPQHFDRNPSMGYDARRHKVHCFACNADYDLFDLLMLEEDLPTVREALGRASRLFGDGSAANLPVSSEKNTHIIPSNPTSQISTENTNYFFQRGLSQETISQFGLKYEPESHCVVIPCDNGDVIRRSVLEKRYFNEKGKPSPLFQASLLGGTEPVFLVEGAFDALSIEELGYRACAMNGAGNKEKIAAILRQMQNLAPILLLPDNDRAGDAWASSLMLEFPWLYRCLSLPAGKDINEYMLQDRDGAAWFL